LGRTGKTDRFDIGSTKRLFCQYGIKEVHEEERCRKKVKSIRGEKSHYEEEKDQQEERWTW